MTTPYHVPMGEPAGAPAPSGSPTGAPAAAKPSPLAFLKTRNGKIGAAGGGVVLLALYARAKKSSAAGTAADGTSGAAATAANPQGTADTSATDLYNTLEPLIEKASGFTDASSIEAQLAAQLAAINKLGGAATPATIKAIPAGYGLVGQVGKTYKITDYLKGRYPNATAAQLQSIFNTVVHDPQNKADSAAFSKGIILGGQKVYFPAWSPPNVTSNV